MSITNVEADHLLRSHINENGSMLSREAIGESNPNEFWPLNQAVGIGIEKVESLTANVTDVGIVPGVIACRGVVLMPGAERLFGTSTEGSMLLRVQLGWNHELSPDPKDINHISTANYRFETSDPKKIDDYYLNGEDSNSLDDIEISYAQQMPEEPVFMDSDDVLIKYRKDRRAKIIRAFKTQFPYLTLLSTTTAGNIHDDEIPLLAEWFVS